MINVIGKKLNIRRKKIDIAEIELCDISIRLTKDQVKAALTYLISNHKQTRTVGSRKCNRNKSLNRSIENPIKKSKQIYNEIVVSNITQSNTMVLVTSGLNNQQIKQIKKLVLLFNCR